jgi:alpha-D-ribose 1-methylphosphonate 5-triphosphate synthase subunit PhnG
MLAALLALTAAPAIAATPANTFSNDGDTYSYTATRAPNGTVLVNGRVETTGDTFALRVAGRDVSGRMGDTPVSFTVSADTLARLTAEVPADTQTAALGAN